MTADYGALDALYEIMRQASYLPLHSYYRNIIEAAASEAIRLLSVPPTDGSACQHEWQDTGFADLDECPRCGATRSTTTGQVVSPTDGSAP